MSADSLIERLAEWQCDRTTQQVINRGGAASYFKDCLPETQEDYRKWAKETLAIIRQHEAEQPQNMVDRVKEAMRATGCDCADWSDEPLTEIAKAAIAAMGASGVAASLGTRESAEIKQAIVVF
jgi:hypothetical protein